MDCSHMSQQRPCARCSQMIPPPKPAMDCGCTMPLKPAMDCGCTMPPLQPAFSPLPCHRHDSRCPDTSVGGMEKYPVGMGYIPWQQWCQTYPIDRAMQRGTIFPDLDLPFVMGRCR